MKGNTVDAEQLLAEGRRLARPCIYLRASGSEYAGIWGGSSVVPAPTAPVRHWISVDCRYLPDQPRDGCLSVYTGDDEESYGTGFAVFAPGLRLPDATDGTRLFADRASSLPPVDAVFLLGSSEVGDWLAANKWQREWGHSSNFRDRGPADAYERVYQGELPFFNGSAHAVLGGWHMPWPDGDFEELVNQHLCVWTFADSEPWLEVWDREGEFRVIERIT